jgi:hypothetical protein
MGLFKKLFGGGGEDRAAAAHDAELPEFLRHGSVQPGTPAPAGDKDAVTDADVAAAFGAAVVDREVALEDESVVNLNFRLRRGDGDDSTLSVFICNHTGLPGMAADDESCWRDTGVARELPDLGDSAFVNDEGTLFARLGDRYTIQILSGKQGPTDENVEHCRALARSILDRLAAG